MKNKPRLRFAPSPTGFLHVGSLRTILFAYAIARKNNGDFVLRIEDTDEKRKVEGAVEALFDIIKWLGIKFDEGPQIGGDFGPYIQSERQEIYKKHIDRLLEEEKVYPCFCSAERLEKMREEQKAQNLAPKYDRTCRNLDASEAKKRMEAGEKYVIRQKMPLEGEVVVRDALRGEIKYRAEDLDDHVLIKTNGVPTYQFAVVVDDYEMKITHVLRGEEWIPSFPKNVLLYRDFGWQEPEFIHISLTLSKEGGKLSKRQGDVAVEDYRRKGYLPEALINYSVLSGWHPKGDEEILSLDEFTEKFDYKDLGISGAVFDIEKLDYFNGVWIRKKNLDELTRLCLPYLINDGILERTENEGEAEKFKNKFNGEEVGFDFIKGAVASEQERIKKLDEVSEATEFFFKLPEYEAEILIWKKIDVEQTKKNLKKVSEILEKIPEKNWTNNSIYEAIIDYIKSIEGKNGDYLWPFRTALTGRKTSPPPFDVAEVLGKKESLSRIKTAIAKL